MPNPNTGYSAVAVGEYVESKIEFRRANGRTGKPVAFVGPHRIIKTDLTRCYKWRSGQAMLVSIDVVDKLMIRLGLSLWEFEDWALMAYGSNCFHDHEKSIAALTAFPNPAMVPDQSTDQEIHV